MGLVCKRFYLITDESRYPQPLLVLIIASARSHSSRPPCLFFLKAFGRRRTASWSRNNSHYPNATTTRPNARNGSDSISAPNGAPPVPHTLSVHLFGPRLHTHLSRLTNTGTARRARRVGGVSIVRATTRIGSMTASSEWPSSAMWGRARYLAWIPYSDILIFRIFVFPCVPLLFRWSVTIGGARGLCDSLCVFCAAPTKQRSFLTRFVDDAYLGSRALRKSMTVRSPLHGSLLVVAASSLCRWACAENQGHSPQQSDAQAADGTCPHAHL